MKSDIVAPYEEITGVLIEAASWAPSVHNTQPWWFGVHGSRVSVHADPDRRLEVADPHGREMIIACGAALFALRLAARHLGRIPEMRLLPDPERPTLLADVDIRRHLPATPAERRMFAQIKRRRTHRGGFVTGGLPATQLSRLYAEARQEGALLRVVAAPRARQSLAALSEAAEQAHRLNPAYVAELARWAPAPHSRRRDGVRANAYPRDPIHTDPPFAARDFARGLGWGRAGDDLNVTAADATGTVLLLMTSGDEPADWLAAGMALERVLLRATEGDVSAAFHTQALEIAELRALIRSRFCDGAHPQMLIRLGHVPDGTSGGGVRRPCADLTWRTL